MELKEVLKKRHSVRSFKPKKVKLRDIFSILEAALNAPMAGNLYSVQIIMVDDEEKKKKIAEASPHNRHIADASHVLVVCSNVKKVVNVYGNEGKHYAAQQAGAAIENMLLRVTDLGLGSCWTAAFDDNVMKRILAIPNDLQIEAILPIGYEWKKPAKKQKPILKNILSYNKFGKRTW